MMTVSTFGLHSAATASRANSASAGVKMPGLGVVNIGVLDKRQIAGTAGNSDVQMVLDAPRLGTMPDPQIPVPGVGVERNEHDLHTFSPKQCESMNIGSRMVGSLSTTATENPKKNLGCHAAAEVQVGFLERAFKLSRERSCGRAW